MMKSLRLWFIPILILLSPHSVASVDDSYKAGIKAFRGGDYENALQHFQAAEAAGLDNARLFFNLGSTYYKLGRYNQSREYFSRLEDHPKWGGLANYNLGLIAEDTGDQRAAMRYYTRAYRAAAPGSKIRELATLKMRELKPDRDVTVTTQKWQGLLSAAVGYDDNANLASDTGDDRISEEGDAFTELFGFANYYLQGDFRDGYRLNGGFYSRLYFDESEFSFSTLFLGLTRDKQWDTWHTQAGIFVNGSVLEDDYFGTTGTLRLAARRNFDRFRLRLQNDLSGIETRDSFDFLSGIRNQSTIELLRPLDIGKIRVGYQLELNDRKDQSIGNEFFSYSPIRNKIYVDFDYFVAPRWILNLRGEYRKSLYPDDNRQINADGTVVTDERDDDYISVTLRAEYEFVRDWATFGEYRYTDNDSNFDRFSYESNQVMFGISRSF